MMEGRMSDLLVMLCVSVIVGLCVHAEWYAIATGIGLGFLATILLDISWRIK